MHNQEQLLTNFNFILGLQKAGFSSTEIARDINHKFACEISPRQLRYLIHRVHKKTIHNEYNSIIILDHLRDAWDRNLDNYCVDFHGLLVTYKCLACLTDAQYIITPDNLVNLVSNKESILYAKRMLKLYHIPDEACIEQHRHVWPKMPEINLSACLNKIHSNLNTEFNMMLNKLHNKYADFLTNHKV